MDKRLFCELTVGEFRQLMTKGYSVRKSKRPPDKVVDGVRMHWCNACKKHLPATKFSKDRSQPDELHTRCRACWREYRERPEVKEAIREYMRKYRARPKVIPETKKCSDCGITKPASEFYGHSLSPDGLEGKCKKCFIARDAFQEAFRRRKTLKAGLLENYTEAEWRKLLELAGNECAHPDKAKCSGPIHRDHVIPLSWAESTNKIDNIQPMCTYHHRPKGNSNSHDYLALTAPIAREWSREAVLARGQELTDVIWKSLTKKKYEAQGGKMREVDLEGDDM